MRNCCLNCTKFDWLGGRYVCTEKKTVIGVSHDKSMNPSFKIVDEPDCENYEKAKKCKFTEFYSRACRANRFMKRN